MKVSGKCKACENLVREYGVEGEKLTIKGHSCKKNGDPRRCPGYPRRRRSKRDKDEE